MNFLVHFSVSHGGPADYCQKHGRNQMDLYRQSQLFLLPSISLFATSPETAMTHSPIIERRNNTWLV